MKDDSQTLNRELADSLSSQTVLHYSETLIIASSGILLCNIMNMKSQRRVHLLAFAFSILFGDNNKIAVATSSSSYQNVEGSALQSCSNDGTALTGYTRNGYCVDQDDDAGSHHICINLSSIATSGQNFCSVTGQSDWCSSTDMPCHENPNESSCAIENWCVCQWAFASYIEKAGGCEAIQDIQCSAINMKALIAYQSDYDKYGEALSCLYERCEVDISYALSYSASTSIIAGESVSDTGNAKSRGLMIGLGIALALLVAMVGYIFIVKKRRGKLSMTNYDDGRVWKRDDMTAKMSIDEHSHT